MALNDLMLNSSASIGGKNLQTLKHTRSSHKLKAPNRQESRNLDCKYVTARGRRKNRNVEMQTWIGRGTKKPINQQEKNQPTKQAKKAPKQQQKKRMKWTPNTSLTTLPHTAGYKRHHLMDTCLQGDEYTCVHRQVSKGIAVMD